MPAWRMGEGSFVNTPVFKFFVVRCTKLFKWSDNALCCKPEVVPGLRAFYTAEECYEVSAEPKRV